jgi:hydroxymethylbilane synthase
VAVLCDIDGAMLVMHVALFSPDGAERVEGAATFPAGDEAGPARLAADLLARATPGIAGHFTGPR